MFTFGFSPCPNDTYIFYALANSLIQTKGLNLNFKIEDVETLNQATLRGELDISKVSCHLFFYINRDYEFLHKGAAFGRGCGPLVVSKRLDGLKSLSMKKIAIPGLYTTAFLLLRLLSHEKGIDLSQIRVMQYNEIIPSIVEGSVDAGLIIHESRFTYDMYGLNKIVDLGQWWESSTGLPIPLGGIVAKKSLGKENLTLIENLIDESLKFSDNSPTQALPYIKRYAQELSDDVIKRHIELYVNEYSRNWNIECENSLKELLNKLKGVKDRWMKA
ncbi:MAG: 1,4-dihydroxy-6-naphthoate synthase [Thermodesulfovibrionales bacterium]|nr:1,4-dihydroxy-6-naphthoate synthase [Thermodesulfovibrionales bacterium]